MTTDLRATDTASLSTVTQGIASLVWWSFAGTRLTPDELRLRVSAAGLDPDAVADIDPIKGLTQAVREFSVRDGKIKIMEAAVAHEDDAVVVINLLRLTPQGRKVAKLPVMALVWDKASSTWANAGDGDEAAQLRDRVLDRQTYYDGNAVRDLLVQPAVLAGSAFSLRRGMYVVPHSTAAPVALAQEALHGLESFTLHVASVAAGQGWEPALQEAASSELRNELDELREQIDGWRDMTQRVRTDTRETVLARFQQLRERAELYQQALAVTLEDLAEDVQELEAVALDVIEGNDREAEQREAAKRAPEDPAQARLAALANMADEQLAVLWAAMGDGEAPADRDELIAQLAEVMPG